MPDAEKKTVGFHDLGVQFQIEIGGIVDLVTVSLGPDDERQLPSAELRSRRTMIGYLMTLQSRAPVVGVEARSTPVVVSIISVGRKLEEDAGVLSRLGRTQDKKAG